VPSLGDSVSLHGRSFVCQQRPPERVRLAVGAQTSSGKVYAMRSADQRVQYRHPH
jgi:hypothetical protein